MEVLAAAPDRAGMLELEDGCDRNGLGRPCSSTSSASEVFSTAHIDGDTSEDQVSVRVPGEDMQNAVRTLLAGVGEDPDRQGLRDTPKRVAKAWLDITTGYGQDVSSILGQALFDEPAVSGGAGGMVMVRDIEFASTSAANLLPFHGRCHVAYLPSAGVVLGLSKFARLTGLYARRFQDQQKLTSQIMVALMDALYCIVQEVASQILEEFTNQILAALTEQLAPLGAAVLVEAKHMAGGPVAPTHLTSAAHGAFAQPGSGCATEFLALLRLNGVPVSPSSGMPSGPRMVLEAVEKRNVVGRGLRHPKPTVALAMQQATKDVQQQRRQTAQQQATHGQQRLTHQQRQPQQQQDIDMADAPAERPTTEQMESAVETLLRATVPEHQQKGLQGSPHSYVRQLLASTAGYSVSLPAILSDPTGSLMASRFQGSGRRNDLAASRGVEEFHIRFASQCEHHLLPFYGTTHVAYLPGEGTGQRLSVAQLEAVVAMYSKRLQIQERFTHQLASAVEELASAQGVLVVVEALHMCMVTRGVEKHGSSTTTVAARGSLAKDGTARSQLLLSLCLN